LEDQIIKNFLPNFCFKGKKSNLIQLYHLIEKDKINQHKKTKINYADSDNILERNRSNNSIENSFANNITQIKNNNSISDSESPLQGKKRNRESPDFSSQKYDGCLNSKSDNVSEKFERGVDVEVKLICDLPNEDMKKAFTKSVKLSEFNILFFIIFFIFWVINTYLLKFFNFIL